MAGVRCLFMVEEIAQALGQGQDLCRTGTWGNTRSTRMRGGLHHAPGVARGTNPASFARVGNHVRIHRNGRAKPWARIALEVLAQVPLDEARDWDPRPARPAAPARANSPWLVDEPSLRRCRGRPVEGRALFRRQFHVRDSAEPEPEAGRSEGDQKRVSVTDRCDRRHRRGSRAGVRVAGATGRGYPSGDR